MNTQLRDLVARALYLTKAHSLPAVCERFGLEPGEENEAFSSKMQSDISQLTFKSMAIVSTLHRHGNSIPFAALR